MKYERAILIAFLGNYIINNIVSAVVALFGFAAAGNTMMQYATYIILAAVFAAGFAWWYFKGTKPTLMNGVIFGVIAFVVAIVTALISGITGVIAQSGSLAQLSTVLPNFVPFIANWTTLAILGYWVVPAVLVAFLYADKSMHSSMASVPKPMI